MKPSAFAAGDLTDGPPHDEALEAPSHTASIATEVVSSPEGSAPLICGKSSVLAARNSANRPPHVEAVEASSHTAAAGAETVSSPEDNFPSEGGTYGKPMPSTLEGKDHVIKRRSAPALIQDRTSPANSSLSDATLLNSSRQASPLTPTTPICVAGADDDDVIKMSSSPLQDLSSSVWKTLCKVEKEKARYHELVGQLQADLATERDHALHNRGVAQHALGEAQDDIADLGTEVSELKDQLETEKQNSENERARCHGMVIQLQADLATERDNSQHDRGVARQALGEAQDDIEDLEAEVSELKDQLQIEKQNSEDHLSAYHRCDRGAAAIIADCHERISELEANLEYENRKARHNYSKAEEFMGLAKYWQDAFYQLGHNPVELWKMLVEELKVRGFVFDYSGHLHRVGLRRAVLGAEDVEEWVAGLGDRSLLIQEVDEGNDHDNAMDAMPNGQQSGRNATEMDQSHGSVEEKTAREKQAEAKANEEHVADKDGNFRLIDAVNTDHINERTLPGREPLININAGETTPNNQRHGDSQGSEIADLVVVEQEDFSLREVEEEANTDVIGSNHDLADVSNIDVSTDWVSPGDENGSTDGEGHETVLPMQSLQHCKVRAVNRSRGPKTAAWGTPSSLQNPRTPSFGSRHVLVPLVKTTALESSRG